MLAALPQHMVAGTLHDGLLTMIMGYEKWEVIKARSQPFAEETSVGIDNRISSEGVLHQPAEQCKTILQLSSRPSTHPLPFHINHWQQVLSAHVDMLVKVHELVYNQAVRRQKVVGPHKQASPMRTTHIGLIV